MNGTTDTEPSTVLVAGAGPVGMSAALALNARGISVKILEKDSRDRDRRGSRAIYVHGDTLRTLEQSHPGLGKRLVDEGIIWSTRKTCFRGKEVFSRTYSNPGGSGDLPHFTSLPQVWTEEFMLDAIQEEGIEIRWEAPVEMVDSTSERVRVAIGDGTEFEAEYLIGADGAGSAVRSEIGVAFEGTESANSFIIADVNEQPVEPRAQERVFHYDHPAVDGRNVLLVPFQGGWRVDIQCKVSDDPERLTRDEQIADLVAKTLGDRYRDRVEWVSEYKFKQVTADRMVDEHCRVLLTGEAGHLFAPFGARGMNSGVADVDLAADSIAVALAAQNDRLAEEKIKAYNIERKKAAEFNKMAAGQALEYLQGDGMYVKAKKRVAAAVANLWEPAGEWLDDAPYGPHGGPRVNIGQY